MKFKLPRVKVDYNAPVVLTFALVALLIRLLSSLVWPGLTPTLFAVGSTFTFSDPLDYVRLASHVLGHANFEHLLNNLLLILLLGPILEERYGSQQIALLMLITAVTTGIVNVLFFSTALLGASGIAFMFIILVSIVNVRRNAVPLTFILVFVIFVGGELVRIFVNDNVSQMAHIIGGLVGAVAGFAIARRSRRPGLL